MLVILAFVGGGRRTKVILHYIVIQKKKGKGKGGWGGHFWCLLPKQEDLNWMLGIHIKGSSVGRQ